MRARPKGKLALVYSTGACAPPLQPTLDSQELARTLRTLAARAGSGELVGAAVVVWKGDETYEMQVSGLLNRDTIKAYYAASRLADALLYDCDKRG